MYEQTFDHTRDLEPVRPLEERMAQLDKMKAREREIDVATERARAAAAAVSAAQAELVDAIADLEQFEGRIAATWRQWVAWQCGLTSTETSRLCNLAKRLPDLPLISAAFRAGELSEGVTDLIAKVATPDNEASILRATEVATGQQLQVLVADYRRMLRTDRRRNDPADDDTGDAAQLQPSEASWGWDEAGRFTGRWDLRPDDGATLEAALEAALAAHRPSEEDIDANPVTAGELSPEERSRGTRADALTDLAENHLAAMATDGAVPEAHQVILRRELDAADLHPDGSVASAVDSVLPTILDGAGAIVRRLAEAMACGALVITQDLIAGFPVSQPTASRTFSRAQRRALRARDRTCRFPGCGRTRNLHAHHTRHWEHTHRTSVAEGVLLCRQHHTLVHLRRHTIELGTDHVVTVTRPDGSTLRGSRPGRAGDGHEPMPDRPHGPGPDLRRTGTGERLTHYARDVFLEVWDRPPKPDAA